MVNTEDRRNAANDEWEEVPFPDLLEMALLAVAAVALTALAYFWPDIAATLADWWRQ